MPVDGLEVRPAGVYVDGIPYTQRSQAERLLIAIELAMSLQPDLRVMRISDGNALDGESLDVLAGLTDKYNFQIWIELVKDNDDGIGYHFVNGELEQ